MDRQNSIATEQDLWRIHLKELRSKTGMSNKQIAEQVDASEKTICRIFSGEAKNPGVDLVRRIIKVLGGDANEIFAESGAVIGGKDLATLQAEVVRLTEEVERLTQTLNIANLDLAVQRDKVFALENENKLLLLKIEYEEKLIAVHNFYNKLNSNN